MSHTPGPWRYVIRTKYPNGHVNGIWGPDGEEIVVTDSGVYPPTIADARLISAAPDLLEAAQDVIAQFERIKQHQHALLGHGLVDAIRNWDEATMGLSIDFSKLIVAIAKAEG